MTTRCRSRESRRHGSVRRAAAALSLGLLLGCSATSIDKPGGAGGSSTGGNGTAASPSFGGDLMMSNDVHARCSDGDKSLKCQVMDCPADSSPSTTTVSGKVYDPAGRVPLYNAVVYIVEDPKTTLKPLGQRVKCESCSEHFPKTAMAVALTGSDGSFRLTDVPVGEKIPLVIQLGKWRRVVEIDVAPCTDNPLSAEKTRLPRNSTEGDLPKIAVTTGGSDALECLLKKIGVDEAEFTPDNGPGRVNLFAGYRAASTINVGGVSKPLRPAEELWASSDQMLNYDMILMGCEGAGSLWKPPEEVTEKDPVPLPRPVAMQLEVRKYADLGGRIFGSHWHHRWINSDDTTPDNPYPASGPALATFAKSSKGFEDQLKKSLLVEVDATFPKGIAFRDWLVNVKASTVPGQLSVKEAEHSVDSVNPTLTRQWIYGTDPLGVPDTNRVPEMVQYFSFTAPVGAAEECGRMVFSDLHVSIGGGDEAATPFPERCAASLDTELSPQEKALEFMIFDLSSCIQKEDDEVSNPIPVVK
jgi:hypothetical protein